MTGLEMMLGTLGKMIPTDVWELVKNNVSKMAGEVNEIKVRQVRIEEKLDALLASKPQDHESQHLANLKIIHRG